MSLKTWIWRVAAASVAVFSAGVMAADGVTAASLRIGMVNAQTGPASGLGTAFLTGASAVFAEVNAAGGVNGRAIDLRVFDDGYEPEQTVLQTLKMVQEENVLSLFGFVGTPTANAALPLIRELEVPLVGAFTGAMSLRSPVTRQVFNVRASYDDETEALVAQLLAQGARSVAVVYQFDGFGLAVLSGTEKALKRRGMSLAATGKFQRNTVAVQAAVDSMLAAAPDAVVMAGPYTPLAAFVQQARTAGLPSRLATVSFVGTDDLLKRVGPEGDGLLISQVVPFPHDDAMAVTRECRALLRRHAGTELGFVNFEGCISAKVLVQGLRDAGPTPTRRSLMDAMEAMRDRNLGGIGIDFSKMNHQASNRVFLTQVQAGRVVAVVPAATAAAATPQ